MSHLPPALHPPILQGLHLLDTPWGENNLPRAPGCPGSSASHPEGHPGTLNLLEPTSRLFPSLSSSRSFGASLVASLRLTPRQASRAGLAPHPSPRLHQEGPMSRANPNSGSKPLCSLQMGHPPPMGIDQGKCPQSTCTLFRTRRYLPS